MANELFDEEPGQSSGSAAGEAAKPATGKMGTSKGSAKPKTTAARVAAPPTAPAAETEALTDPFAQEGFESLAAESSSEPAGATPLMAAPTSPGAYAPPSLPERIAEASVGQAAPDIFAGEGLKFQRHYTREGEDVFDTTEWDMRTAAITGERGEVVFEQKDCEIPRSWSMLATNVVVSKYFRGKIGTPQRENSVRQLVSRVADTIYKWGKAGNYFASDEDADIFHDELKYLLLHQYMAFNSPVWFNLGVPGEKPQVSACQPYDALVSTPQGLIPIGKLVEENAVGTVVYDCNGTTRIVATKANGRKPVLRLHTKAGYTLDVTADHLVWRKTSGGKMAGSVFGKFVEAGTLREGDRLAWHRTPLSGKSLEGSREEAEVALAGWLQSDGFAGQYEQGTNRSLTIEAMVVNADEESWVRDALAQVFPDAHSHTRSVVTRSKDLDCKRIRLYGENLRSFVEKWNLLARGTAMQVPSSLYIAPYSIVTAYLRSLFQAEGYVVLRENARIGLDMISEEMVRGVQKLLLRFGIYSRVRFKSDARDDRKGCWSLLIMTLGDRKRFAREIGFVGTAKQAKLLASLERPGLEEGRVKTMEIERIEPLGEMDVYDIQTESSEYLSGNLRVHNCFINSVEDTMESILTLAKTEGMLFKWGSGTGTNLSVLRSSRESLKGGGTASGPVSFMRGFDSFAGAIKSGGKTRRAAKMVILNADHPDIDEFIECKADAEKKAHALIEAGYSGAFNVPNGAYDSVYFQNANHSVRATDDFMRAVELDRDWMTVNVLNGQPAHTFRARDLMHKIAGAAWVCGDPGMQFDTTINRWHTCPNSARINASNPCVTGDTLVATADGWQRIDALVDKVAQIYGADGQPHFVTRIFPTGTKQIFCLRTKSGYELRLTGDHKVLTTEGDVPATELRVGDKVLLQGAGFGRQVLGTNLALAVGIAAGEASSYWEGEDGRQQALTLVMPEDEEAVLEKVSGEVNRRGGALAAEGWVGRSSGVTVSNRVGAGAGLTISYPPLIGLFKDFLTLCQGTRRRFTPAVFDLDRASVSAVLRGLFTADGTVMSFGDKSQYVALDATSMELLKQVQLLLLSFGIKAKIYNERLPEGTPIHSLRISRSSRFLFERHVGFDPSSPKAAALADMNAAFGVYHDALTDEVASLEPLGEEPVYDLTEPVTSHFSANGLIVHNCSEYMFLDDSACNLASLNLMRFRKSNREFDVEAFKNAVRVTITAMEIMVGNAAYPTDKITVNSFDYRPLGLGYANLGALLMARGLPYDSDEGRAYAAAITAIMSGEAYHQSAKMAGRVGPFSGYERNKQPFLRVMQMHRDHVEAIHDKEDLPADMLDAARGSWDDALTAGRDSGFRNSQISVLAPTGCLVAGSLVLTDRGLMRLDRLGNVSGSQWQDVNFQVLTDEGPRPATKFYVNGVELTRRLTTNAGYAIQGTLKHRIKIVDPATGRMVWKRFADITPGDVVALSMGQLVGQPRTVSLPPLGEEYWTGDYTTRAPRTMTPELAELIGYFMGDGSLHSKGPRFCAANTDADVAERVRALVKDLFNLDAHITPQEGYAEVAVHSVPLALWWEACGFAKHHPGGEHTGKGYVPHVPDAVLATNDPAVYGAFLRGLYEADGTVTGGVPCWTTVQRSFSEEVKTLLLALGIPTATKRGTTGWGNSTAYCVRLRNASYAPVFLQKVGFMGARKAARVTKSRGEQTARHDYIYLAPEVIDELVPADHPLRNAIFIARRRHGGAITRRAAEALYAENGDARLGHALGFFYDAISANEDGGEQYTYDLSVPDNVTYIAQGFISHNTIGFMMDCDTTGVEPDIAIVKFKSLVGGGMFKIVNQTVPEALERLGYSASERKAILDYIEANDTIEGAPGLAEEHLPVFDCAFRARNGTRTIHYMGHVKMMSAVQPFLSGAISKTVNMPHDATPDDIAEAYLQAWKLGIKALAIYRDGSKKTQPLSTSSASDQEKDKQAKATAIAEARPLRRKLPDERQSLTHKFSVGGHEGYLTIGLYPEGTPGEIFITMSKEGSVVSGLMDSFATAISLALQYGVPLKTLVDKFMHTRFEPSGFTGNPDIPMAKSIMDYLFRYLALKFLDRDERANVGLIADQKDEYDNGVEMDRPVRPTVSIEAAAPSTAAGQPGPVGVPAPVEGRTQAAERQVFVTQADAPPCPECGSITTRNGACYRCANCGTSIGCS